MTAHNKMQRATSMPMMFSETTSLKRHETQKLISSGKIASCQPTIESRKRQKKAKTCPTNGKRTAPVAPAICKGTVPRRDRTAGSSHARLFEKNGHENVLFKNIPDKSSRFMRDFVTTLIDLNWFYILIMFAASYVLSWAFFALLSYFVSYSHGDLSFDEITGARLSDSKQPCVMGVYDFISMFIYSFEVQTTVGFGEKYPSEECADTIFLFVAQIICSIAIEGGMISLIYAKVARPTKQITKLKFSDKAVVCYRDGRLCLLFRVCDPREQQTIESQIRLYLIGDKRSLEGEAIKTYTELKLSNNGRQLIAWPEIVCHLINESSPLSCYTNAREFNEAKFELLVTIVGVSPATAQVTEARTSYVPGEIYWGQRFVNIIHYDTLNEQHVVDYNNFNATISVDMADMGERESTE